MLRAAIIPDTLFRLVRFSSVSLNRPRVPRGSGIVEKFIPMRPGLEAFPLFFAVLFRCLSALRKSASIAVTGYWLSIEQGNEVEGLSRTPRLFGS